MKQPLSFFQQMCPTEAALKKLNQTTLLFVWPLESDKASSGIRVKLKTRRAAATPAPHLQVFGVSVNQHLNIETLLFLRSAGYHLLLSSRRHLCPQLQQSLTESLEKTRMEEMLPMKDRINLMVATSFCSQYIIREFHRDCFLAPTHLGLTLCSHKTGKYPKKLLYHARAKCARTVVEGMLV